MKFRSKYDVIVVGGGPGGCIAAKECAERGLSVLLLERHREIGIPVRCGEAVGIAGLLEFFNEDHWIIKTYRKKFKIRFIAPDGNQLDLNHTSEAVVLDRKVFDHELGIMASNAGAQIIVSANATGLIRENEKIKGVEFEFNGKNYSAYSNIIIGADGIESRIGRWAGIKTAPKFNDIESCVQYTVAGSGFEPDRLDFYFGRDVAPTGYLWVFPKNNGTANIGLGVNGLHSKEKKASVYLDEFMDAHYPNCSIVTSTCGGVICGETLDRISDSGIMLLGDAAHQTNAISGGGIVNAMKAGRIAAEVAAEAVRSNDFSSEKLSAYDKKWAKKQGNANHKFYIIKNIVEKIEDETLNSITESLNKQPFEKRTLINIFKKVLIKHPALILDLPKLFS